MSLRSYKVESDTVPGVTYDVTIGGPRPRCTCKQGQLGNRCKHVERAEQMDREEFEQVTKPQPGRQAQAPALPFEEPAEQDVSATVTAAMEATENEPADVEQAIAAVYGVVAFVQKESAKNLNYSFAGEAGM